MIENIGISRNMYELLICKWDYIISVSDIQV